MTIHPILQSGGALIGGLLTLGLFVYNLVSLFSVKSSRSRGGCSIK